MNIVPWEKQNWDDISVIKRRFHSEIKSYDDSMKTKELLYWVLACNCHRMCLILLVLIMISRKPKNDYVFICLRLNTKVMVSDNARFIILRWVSEWVVIIHHHYIISWKFLKKCWDRIFSEFQMKFHHKDRFALPELCFPILS